MPWQFMVDVEGLELSGIERTLLKHPNVGAVLLFTRNFINISQLHSLVAEIRDCNPELFIAVDQEGGNVQRFQRQGFSSLPAARVYGRVYDQNPEAGIALALEYGELMAKELLQCGIDLSLAPILDLHAGSPIIAELDRAFHQDPKVVAVLAAAFVQGMYAAGMPAVGKHFPGHGAVLSDSHLARPVLETSLAELQQKDMYPFCELIRTGILAGLMPAHVTYKALDKDNPAGFSSIWLHDLLRTQLGFKGLVLSDCLSMKGADVGNLTTRAEKALQAGCDMLIVSQQERTLLQQLLDSVVIPQNKDSLARIKTFKSLMLYFRNNQEQKAAPAAFVPEDKSSLSSPDTYDELNKTVTI